MPVAFWLLIVVYSFVLFACVPAGVVSFVLLHKTYGGRKVLVLIFPIVFFVLFGVGIICLTLDDPDAFYFLVLAIPFPITSFILALTRPKNIPTTQLKKSSEVSSDYISELERLKKLLDCGGITKEEYDKKKTEILNRK